MNFLVFGIVLIIAAFGSSADAHAQTGKAQIEKSCTNAKSAPRSRIAQCTAYIESIKVDLKKSPCPLERFGGPPSPERRRGTCTNRTDADLARSFVARAVAYADSGDLAHALEDLNQALQLDSGQPSTSRPAHACTSC
jgi:hypothetical protein